MDPPLSNLTNPTNKESPLRKLTLYLGDRFSGQWLPPDYSGVFVAVKALTSEDSAYLNGLADPGIELVHLVNATYSQKELESFAKAVDSAMAPELEAATARLLRVTFSPSENRVIVIFRFASVEALAAIRNGYIEDHVPDDAVTMRVDPGPGFIPLNATPHGSAIRRRVGILQPRHPC